MNEHVAHEFTHKGLFAGVVPIYLSHIDSDAPYVVGRWWWCDLLMEIIEPLFGLCISLRTLFDDDYEPTYPMQITGEINPPRRM